MILFNEDHDKKTIWEDVDFVTSLKPDYLQFSLLGPIPGTQLYDDYDRQDKLIKEIPYEAQHGQNKIWFHHDKFKRDETDTLLRLAFEIDYSRNGASMLRAVETILKGHHYCKEHEDPRIKRRVKNFENRLEMMRYFLPASTLFVQNRQSEILLTEVKKSFRSQFGRMGIVSMAASLLVLYFSVKEYVRCRIFGDLRVPKTSYLPLNRALERKDKMTRSSNILKDALEVPYKLSKPTEI